MKKTDWLLGFEAGVEAGKKAKLEEIQEALGIVIPPDEYYD